eukprot:238922_1
MRDANNTLSHQLYDCLHLWIELLVSWWKGQDQKEMDHDSSQWSQLQSQCFSTSTSINTSFFLRASFTSLIICFVIGASFRLLSMSDARNSNSNSNSESNNNSDSTSTSTSQQKRHQHHRLRRLISRVWIYISRRSTLLLHFILKCILGDNIVNTPLLAKQTHKREHYTRIDTVAGSKSNLNSNPGSSDAGDSDSDSDSGGAHIQILRHIRSRYEFVETYGLHWPFCMLWDRMIRKSNVDVDVNVNVNVNANSGKSCGDHHCLVGGTAWIPRYPNILKYTSASA